MDKAITEKNYRKIDTKFFNMHFSVPRKDGKLITIVATFGNERGA